MEIHFQGCCPIFLHIIAVVALEVHAGLGSCVHMGPSVQWCSSICGIAWGTTQVILTDLVVDWLCAPATLQVNTSEEGELPYSIVRYIYSIYSKCEHWLSALNLREKNG